ncbi:MAG: arsenate reductase (glutaredoxin) [Bacteroidota bacterium]
MTTIYHNPRCTKSRETMQFLEQKGETITVIQYLEQVPTQKELRELIKMLGIQPIELVRKNEAVWKEQYKGKELTNAQIIKAMVTHPRLIERPIVVKNGRAAIGRPPESVSSIL